MNIRLVHGEGFCFELASARATFCTCLTLVSSLTEKWRCSAWVMSAVFSSADIVEGRGRCRGRVSALCYGWSGVSGGARLGQQAGAEDQLRREVSLDI
jgi:hypothetical protein